MECVDWRLAPPARIRPLLAAEAQHYRSELGWEVGAAWAGIEPSRAAGQLPGLLVTDDEGRTAGWCCFLVHRRSMQVAMLVADTADTTRLLVESIVKSPEAGGADMHLASLRDAAPGLRASLEACGFTVERYRYLSVQAAGPHAIDRSLRRWRDADAAVVAELFQQAYAESLEVRAFAPGGTLDEWQEYATSLLTGLGCGKFLPEASYVAAGSAGRLDGAVVTTDLGPDTAHIAQVAVRPSARGAGLGRRLIAAALSSAAASSFDSVTLFVAAGNHAACSLYARLGFLDRATFFVGVNRQPRRSTSAAPDVGGASTRL